MPKLATPKPVREVKFGVRPHEVTHGGTGFRNASSTGSSSCRAKLTCYGCGLAPVAADSQFADTDNLSDSSAAEPS